MHHHKKILLIAYQLSPFRGSEYSVAWNYIVRMAREHNLTVLYGATGQHMGEIDPVDEYNAMFPEGNVQFIPVYPKFVAKAFNCLNRHGIFVYSFYFAYNSWQKQVFHIARELAQRQNFDLVHFLGPIGFREPGYIWKLKLPYIWGPIGGMTNTNWQLMKKLPFHGFLKFAFRSICNTIQLHFNLRVRRSIRRADALLAATTENRDLIKKYFKCEAIYLPENAINMTPVSSSLGKFKQFPINLIWIGSIDARKNLQMMIDILARMSQVSSIRLHVVGDGPLNKAVRKKALELHLDGYIVWHGNIARENVFRLLNNSHLHVITSIMEGNPTTIWEAMAAGVPTISLDHCGMHDTICDQCGIKIPITNYNNIVTDFAKELDDLIQTPERLHALAVGTNYCAKKYTWESRQTFFNNIYDKAIANFKQKYDSSIPNENS